MKDRTHFENRFQEVCFTLSESDILELEKSDDGSLNNVISNINNKCYGVALYEEEGNNNVEMFYVTNNKKLQGDIICLKLSDPDYFSLLIYFCYILSLKYTEIEAVDTFNIFQNKLRTGLEKLGYFTVTTLELKKFEGNEILMIPPLKSKGVKKIILLDKVEYYRTFFGNNYKNLISSNKEYVYLMLNALTSLIKIGFSKDPSFREKTLHSEEPSIFLIAFWETNKIKEKELHQKYKHIRVRGEWFRLNFADLKELDEFMN